MKTNWKRLRAAAAVATAAIALMFGAARAQNISADIKLLTPDAINAGDPVKISCEVENTGADATLVPPHFFAPGSSDGAGMFFVVKDERGAPLRSACAPQIPATPGAAVPFRPGEYHGFRSYDLSACFSFEEGKTYQVSAEFISRANTPGAWNGSALSNSVSLTVKEDAARKKSLAAEALVAQWLSEYNYHTADAAKRNIATLGTAAAPAVVNALRAETRMLAAGDLLDLLGSLPCRESVDALIYFVVTGGGERFRSGVTDEFSGASILVDAAIVSLEKLSGERFTRDKGDLADQWYSWHERNRHTFKPALGER